MGEVLRDLFGNLHVEEPEENNNDHNPTLLGRYAEFMVCAQISKAGFYVTHVDGVGFDLIINTEFGSFTIQVKSTSNISNGVCTWRTRKHVEGTYNRNNRREPRERAISTKDAQILALYHHIYNTTIITPVRGELSYSYKVYQVQQASLEKTLADTLWYLKGNDSDDE